MADARLDDDRDPARPAPAPDDPGARAAREQRRSGSAVYHIIYNHLSGDTRHADHQQCPCKQLVHDA
jgi:hypothetical protein